jgi:uncharacterized protein (TIGR00299 family) protein
MRFLFLDCAYAGISGDLLVSSLSGLIDSKILVKYLNTIVTQLPHLPHIEIDLIGKLSHGIYGNYLQISLRSSPIEADIPAASQSESDESQTSQNKHHHHPADNHSHAHHEKSPLLEQNHFLPDHSHSNHSHYSVTDLQRDLDVALNIHPFSPKAKKFAKDVLFNLITTEAKIHNTAIDAVHLHELSSADTILDIAGTSFLLEHLGVFSEQSALRVYFSPIAVGGGTVKCAHGILPVPAPATTALLEQNHLNYQHGPVDTELATPTGVALLGELVHLGLAIQGVPSRTYQILKSGIGVGTKDLPDRPNILRSFLCESPDQFQLGPVEPVLILETNIDDLSGEYLGSLMNQLLTAEAYDVSFIPCTTKKNRPGIIVKIIAPLTQKEILSQILFRETGTLGVRIREENRLCMPRELVTREISIDGHSFSVRIKVSRFPSGEIFQEKIEFEDLQQIATALQISVREAEKRVRALLR